MFKVSLDCQIIVKGIIILIVRDGVLRPDGVDGLGGICCKLFLCSLSLTLFSVGKISSGICFSCETSPVSTEAPSRKLSYGQSSISAPQSAVNTSINANNTGRPPTPRKSNILVKAQQPTANSRTLTV
jgi:hypothetical protein